MQNKCFHIFLKAAKPLTGKGLYKLPFASKLFVCLLRSVKPKGVINIEARGHKMCINTLYSGNTFLVMCKGNYEPLTTQLLEKIITRGMVIVDVGASIGYHTLNIARLVGKEGKVFSFEPEPYSFELLVKNIQLNGYENVTAINKAVSNKTTTTMLFIREDLLTKSSLLPKHQLSTAKRPGGYVKVDTVTLDDYFKNYEIIDIIKIDVEGAEPQVISGMTNTIGRNKTLKIITEFHPPSLTLLGNSPEDYFNMLLRQGFNIYNMNEEKNSIERVYDVNLLLNYLDRNMKTDLFCTKDVSNTHIQV